jgi:hypothetical protein
MPNCAFWSLSLYQIEPDGRLFFVPNALNRFALGNRSQGMTRNPNGDLDIMISQSQPSSGALNWLPAPSGPLALVFRAYIPSPRLLDNSWRLPAVVQV